MNGNATQNLGIPANIGQYLPQNGASPTTLQTGAQRRPRKPEDEPRNFLKSNQRTAVVIWMHNNREALNGKTRTEIAKIVSNATHIAITTDQAKKFAQEVGIKYGRETSGADRGVKGGMGWVYHRLVVLAEAHANLCQRIGETPPQSVLDILEHSRQLLARQQQAQQWQQQNQQGQ